MTDTARITVDKVDQVLVEFMAAMDVTFPVLEDKLAFLYRLVETAAVARTTVTDLILDDADGEVSTAPLPDPDVPLASGSGAPLWPRPDWWGEHGCRRADDPAHTCLDVNGRPPEHGRPCAAEARAAMADLFRQYRVPGPIAHGAEEVAARLYEHLAPMDRAVGQ